MVERSTLLADLDREARAALEKRLLERQSDRCFICDEPIDLVVHAGALDIDHIVPLAEQGPDTENNFALCHASCNRSKGASDLRVARRMAEFDRLQQQAKAQGERGANLGHLLAPYGGGKKQLVIKREGNRVQYALDATGNAEILTAPLYKDPLSSVEYFFAVLPLAYIHHDDRINPRPIGSNIRGLIEEFMKKYPQLHVGLAWWMPEENGAGRVRMFDGQHKAAAQILLGAKQLPVRVFVEPDTNVLLTANTHAGDKLRQVAFDVAVLRHLGNTLYLERLRQYQSMKGLPPDNYSFSEKDLVTFFKGEHREMLRYIVDSVRDSITHNRDNKLMEYVEWSGKGADRPLSYQAVERTFFKEFVYKKALETPIGEGLERGDNPRVLERDQLVKLMNLFANVFFAGHWDADIGGRLLENRLQKGTPMPEAHLRAWRVSREEILGNALAWVRLAIENYFAFAGEMVDKERLLHKAFAPTLWERIEAFLRNLADLPCWVDKNLSNTLFGAKQNLDYWKEIFKTGRSPTGVAVLARGLDLGEMIRQHSSMQQGASG